MKRASPQRKAPRLANLVAAELRGRILDGRIPDGASLPKQEDLLSEFRVSLPSIREALRILEAEGLITVVRGNVGGAIVHIPTPANAAYTVSSVLQSRRVTLADVGVAIQHVEPACVELAARRGDRHQSCVPKLRSLQQASRECLTDVARYRELSSEIHGAFVQASGCETLILLAGTLEALWAAHADRQIAPDQWDHPVTPAVRERYVEAHGRIIDAVAAGDADLARSLSQQHLAEATRHTLTDRSDTGIDSSRLASTE